MKILHVVPYFPPAYSFGGPVKAVYQIAKELVKRKHEVVVYTSDAKDLGYRGLLVNPQRIEGHYRDIGWLPTLPAACKL